MDFSGRHRLLDSWLANTGQYQKAFAKMGDHGNGMVFVTDELR